MDTWRFYAITHADHVICNPTSPERLDELIELLDLPEWATVWEAACGKGEFLVRLAERRSIRGTGVDISPYEIAIARERAAARVPVAGLVLNQGDAAAQGPEAGSVDLVVCLGASWIWGGHRGTLRALRSFAKPGGLVLVGEPHWRREPEPAYLAASDLAVADFAALHQNIAIAAEEGLTFLYALPSRDEDWDRYELLQIRAAERYAFAHPDDPDVDELLARARRGADAYLRWGRDTLGWSIYLFRTPRPDALDRRPPDA